MNILNKILLVFFVFIFDVFFVFEFLGNSSWKILAIILFLAFLAFGYIYFLVTRLLNKIKKSALIIEEMAAGNLNKEIKIKKRDEISQISDSLNNLMSCLKSGTTMGVSINRELVQAKADFVSLASHQLRTPLSIIKWYSDFLLCGDAGEFNKDQKKYLIEIFNTNQRMIDLVNALLDVSRIDLGTFSIDLEPTDIIKKANEAIQKYQSLIDSKKIALEVNFEKMPLLNLDPRLILIVFENVLSNSVKYTPNGGRVRFTIKKTDTNILIKVSDTGVGISRDLRDKIFSKMFRAENAKKMVSGGNGLGLYITKAILDKSGGKIWFESPSLEFFIEDSDKKTWKNVINNGLGTTFFINIPLEGMKKKVGIKKLENIE